MVIRHSLGGLVIASILASTLVFAACESSPDSNAVTVAPEAGPPDGAGAVACPAADYLAGKPIPSGGTKHAGDGPGSQVWKAADSPHIVPADTAIAFGAGTSLTIEPCALVVMGKGDSLGFGGNPDAKDIGDLVAAGDATHPIVITGATAEKDAWNGVFLNQTSAATVLSYVTIERAHDGHNGTSLLVSGTSAPRFDHLAVRNGLGSGLQMTGDSTFGAGSGNMVVTGMGVRPVVLSVGALASFPDGTYTGNADDRIEVQHAGGFVTGDVTWHKRSLPYFLREKPITFYGKLTVEPGVHVFVEPKAPTSGLAPNFSFVNGGSLVADGVAETSRIVFEGDQGQPWQGFQFLDAVPIVSLTKSGTGVFNFVTIKNAGGGQALAGGETCSDVTAPNTVIFAGHDVVDVKHTEFFDVGANNFAISRDFCGPGGPYMTEAARGNVFHGTMHCPVSDQSDCLAPGGACADGKLCCLHDYACNGTTVP